MTPLKSVTLILGLIVGAGLSSPVSAHESRPRYIEITELAGDVYSLQWKVPPTVELGNSPTIGFPQSCEAAADQIGPAGDALKHIYLCPKGLAGQELEIRYPVYNPSVSSLVRATWQSGETYTLLAGPDEPKILLPERETRTGIALQYLNLGVAHILEGYDHLLFLVCLLFIAGDVRRILITVTGFTIAHSLTLALSALDLARIPVPPVEAAIALPSLPTLLRHHQPLELL